MQIVYKKVNDLIPYVNNSRTHSEEQVNQIVASINEFGFTNPLLIDEKDSIIAGHGRLLASKKLGMEEVPCIVLKGLTEAQKKAYIIADNKMALNAGWDDELLKLELENLKELDFDLELTGFNVDELDDILGNNEEETEIVEDEVPEVPEEPKAKLGDIYQLGNHRLMCGDSTSEEDVAKLMDGTKADMVFTDPPYGVDIKGKYTGKILNDDLKDNELEDFLNKVNANLKIFCNGSFYICYEVLNSVENFNAFGKPDEIICFNKDSASMPFGKNRYNRKYELILFYKNNGELICDSEPNVWDAPKSSSFNNRDENGKRFNEKGNFCVAHPTTKPLMIPARAIKNSSNEKDNILDLFGGSGSTLIACEQLNRKCYMMELDEHYVSVIIERYINFTGNDVYRINPDGTKTNWRDIKCEKEENNG